MTHPQIFHSSVLGDAGHLEPLAVPDNVMKIFMLCYLIESIIVGNTCVAAQEIRVSINSWLCLH